MVVKAGSNEKRSWTFEKCWYNIPLDKIADSPILQAKYLLLVVGNEEETGNIRKIVKTRHDVWTKERLLKEGYPDASHSSYYMMRIRKENGTDE